MKNPSLQQKDFLFQGDTYCLTDISSFLPLGKILTRICMVKSEKKKLPKSDRKKTKVAQPVSWLHIFLLIAFTFLLYSNSINHDYALDDDIVTRLNSYVQKGLSGIPDIFSHGMLKGFNNINDRFSPYRPLPLMTFAVEKQFFGNNPVAHHFFNVIYYVICVTVVFLLLQKLFPDTNILFPFSMALLFAAHPIHTEVVANIKSRDEILSLLFAALAFLLLMNKITEIEKGKILLAPSIFFFLSLLAKESAITLGMIVPLMLYFFTQLNISKILKSSLPFAGAAIIYLLIRISVQDNVPSADDKMDIINNTLAAAPDLAHRYATAVQIIGKYLLLLIAPVTLSADYSYAQIPIVGWSDWKAFVPLLVILSLLVFSFISFKKKEPLSFCVLYFFITMIMVSNIFMQIGATLAERFLFVPSLSVCIAIPVLLVRISKQNVKNITLTHSRVFSGVIGVILLLFSLKTISRNSDWKNNYTLFTAGLLSAPNSASAHSSYASELRRKAEQEPMSLEQRQKLLDESVEEYWKALKIYPKYAEASYNMGVSFWDGNNIDSAAAAYRRTILINPNYQNALNNLGVYYIKKSKYDSAIIIYKTLIRKNPEYAQAYANIGAAYHNIRSYDSALYYYNKALLLNPNNENVLNNIKSINNLKSGI